MRGALAGAGQLLRAGVLRAVEAVVAAASAVHDLYLLIKDPRATRIAFFLIYLLMLQSGVHAVLDPPSSIAAEIGPFITSVWAVFLVTGGLIGAATVLQGWNFVERVACIAALSGATIYAAVVATLHYTSEGQRLTQWGFVATAVVIFVWRLWEIRRYLIEPRG